MSTTKNLLLAGNGPSADWLDNAASRAFLAAGWDVAVCNLRALDVACSIVAAVDRAMVMALIRGGALNRAKLLTCDVLLKCMRGGGDLRGPDLPRPDQVILISPEEAGYSTGSAAFVWAIKSRYETIAITGYDGSKDGRTKYAGQPGYRTKPTNGCLYRRWESFMLEQKIGKETSIIIDSRMPSDHPLDGLSRSRREDVAAMILGHVDAAR